MQLLGKILGDPNKKELEAIQPLVDKINALEPTIENLSDEELAAKTKETHQHTIARCHHRGAPEN